MKYCYTCGVEIKTRVTHNKPVICKCKNCNTQEFRNAFNQWHIDRRVSPNISMPYEVFLSQIPKNISCVICGAEFFSDTLNRQRKLKETCSPQCTETHRTQKAHDTKIEKYGHAGPNQEKRKSTSLEKYGTEFPQQSQCVKDKAIQTCLERYGVDNASKHPDIIEKIAQRHEELYGVRNIWQRRDIIEASYEKAFGVAVSSPLQIPEIAAKAFNTRSQRFELHGAVPKEAYNRTMLEKYGSTEYFASEHGKMTRENLKHNHNYTDEEVDSYFNSRSLSLDKIRLKFETEEEAIYEFNKIKASYDSSSWEWALAKSDGVITDAIEIYKNRSKSKFNLPRASKSSIKVFNKLEDYLNLKYKNYGTLYVASKDRKEYFLFDNVNKCIYFYDFTIIDKVNNRKLIIEYNGCYYHPKTENDDPISFAKDKRKEECAKRAGFDYIVVWDDIKEKQIVEFLIERVEKWLNTQS